MEEQSLAAAAAPPQNGELRVGCRLNAHGHGEILLQVGPYTHVFPVETAAGISQALTQAVAQAKKEEALTRQFPGAVVLGPRHTV